MRDKEDLLAIAEAVAQEIIDNWFYDWSSWDCVAEDEELTDEEFDFIVRNVKVGIETRLK